MNNPSQPKPSAYRSSASFADSKPHYMVLDGLRGTAALLVLVYHIFEGLAFASSSDTITGLNHGYLAVDFFFLLSGFVIGYAYDERLKHTMSTGQFIKRRLVRLHPMIVMGAIVGAASFILGGCLKWDGTHVALSVVMLSLLCTMFCIPAYPGSVIDVRGNTEMFPLNGPAWSLWFEYIGNLAYVLFIHKLGNRALRALVVVLGTLLAVICIFDLGKYGSLCEGWSLEGWQFPIGLVRMLFPYSLGMLLARNFRPRHNVRGTFWICSLLLLVLFLVPAIPGRSPICWNAVYEMICIMVVFPFILLMGASAQPRSGLSLMACKWLGDLSYPLYSIHYPVMYLFYAWLIREHCHTLAEAWPQALLVVAICLLIALLALKCYDEPLRKWLTRHMSHSKKTA